jgi:ribosomal protein S27E
MIVVSVAKSYSNRGNHRHRQRTKKHWYLYYIDDEGDGKFHTARINALEALYYRGKKRHRYKFACPECGGLSLAYVKSLKEEVECAQCGNTVSLDDLDDESIDAHIDDADDD